MLWKPTGHLISLETEPVTSSLPIVLMIHVRSLHVLQIPMRLLSLILFELRRRSHQMRAKPDIFSVTPVHCILLTLLIYYRIRGELLVRHSGLILLQMVAA